MTSLQQEIDPQKKMVLEQQARQIIGSLTPNRQYPYIGPCFFLVAVLMIIALAKIPFDESFVWDMWAIPAILVLIFFVTVFLLCSEFYSQDISMDSKGLRIKPWVIGKERQFDWTEIETYAAGRLNNTLHMTDGTRIKVPFSGSFAEQLNYAFSVFESRYIIDDESDE